jgi:hypothetical protein
LTGIQAGKLNTISELTKERLRKAGRRIGEEWQTSQAAAAKQPDLPTAGMPTSPPRCPDVGFRVFKLASSNIRAWEPDRDKLAETLEASVEHLKTDRTEQDILFKVITGDDISGEEAKIIAASEQLGHCASELELKRKIAAGEDFTREEVRVARDLIRDRSIVRDLEVIRSNLERRVWSARSRFILEKNVAAYQNRTRRTITRRDERCSLDFRGHELFFRVTGVAHGVARTKTGQRAVEIHARRELFSLTPNRDLIPAIVRLASFLLHR